VVTSTHPTRRALFAVAVWVLVLWSAPGAQRSAPAPSGAPTAVDKALLDRYCVTCHNSRGKAGGLALDVVDVTDLSANAEIWEKVVRKVSASMMPPANMPRPDPAATASFVAAIEAGLDRAALDRPNPGRTLLQRFNRAE